MDNFKTEYKNASLKMGEAETTYHHLRQSKGRFLTYDQLDDLAFTIFKRGADKYVDTVKGLVAREQFLA